MLPTIKLKNIDTQVTFHGDIDWEKHLKDNTPITQLLDNLRPDLNVWLYIPQGWGSNTRPEQHQDLRKYIEDNLGYDSIKGKMRIWDHRGDCYRLWCRDRLTFIRILNLFKDNE
jgi:hypothetical protein